MLADPRAHRLGVVRRLLESGVSVPCLRTLFPDWSTMILALAESLDDEPGSHDTGSQPSDADADGPDAEPRSPDDGR